MNYQIRILLGIIGFMINPTGAYCQFIPKQHRVVLNSEISVSKPGCYGIPGKTYVLANDFSSPGSTIFLSRDVTLDLNGYTLTYADTIYGHIPNFGFEEALTGWDTSKAPGAKIENIEEVHAFIGNKILRLKAGDEIASEYIYLPVNNRSYFAMLGLTGNYYTDMKGDLTNDMRVSIFVDDEQATITNCTFYITNPFIINRHGSEFYAVDLRGNRASEVSFSEFYGGQGYLGFKADFSEIHHNHFVNRQTVTNHYSIMAMGDSSRIFENLIEPEIGSGIEIYIHRGIEIFNNEFHIHSAPPSCEYHLHLSTNAVRFADDGATPASPRGCYANRVHNNRIYINSKKYEKYPDYIPMASAFFYSASGGDNEIFGNDIIIQQKDPDTDAEAFAFYIGNARGRKIYNNNIISNVTPVWVACSYGRANSTVLTGNRIERAKNTLVNFKPVRMGSHGHTGYVAKGTEFRSNQLAGLNFEIDATDQNHAYSGYWTVKINLF